MLIFLSLLFLFQLQFVSCENVHMISVVLDTLYNGKVGDGHYFQFVNPNKSSFLYIIHLSTEKGIPITLFSIASDNSTTFTIITDDAESVALCEGEHLNSFNFFLSGLPGSLYNFSVQTAYHPELVLGQPALYSYTTDGFKWVYFDNNQTELSLHIRIDAKNTNSTNLLYIVQTDCVSGNDLSTSFFTATPHLTFTTYAGFVLSQAREPKLQTGKWFFGILTNINDNLTDSAERNFTITIYLGLSSKDYILPMVLPPIFILLIILTGLAFTLSVMKYLTKVHGLKSSKNTHKDSEVHYFLLIFSVVVIFIVPAFQIIVNELDLMSLSGNHDICYFNGKCEHPSGPFLGIKSLNNVYSNIGYIVVGLGFIIYVYGIRSYVKTDYMASIPRDASIPYAMGLAICLEGVASALYHLCPNGVVFQMDGACMFIILVLGQAELFRRAIYAPTPTAVISSVAFLITANYIGSLADTGTGPAYLTRPIAAIFFEICLTLYSVLILCPFLLKKESEGYFEFLSKCDFKEIPKKRTVGIILVYVANTLILTVGTLYFQINFGTTILVMLVSTQAISIISYETILFKTVYTSKESPARHFIILKMVLFVVVAAFWVVSLFYFDRQGYNTDFTPQKSREIAEECLVAGFYDSHDLWHFFSALALLGNSLVFFHLDLNASYQGQKFVERTGRDHMSFSSSGGFANFEVKSVNALPRELVDSDGIGVVETDQLISFGKARKFPSINDPSIISTSSVATTFDSSSLISIETFNDEPDSMPF